MLLGRDDISLGRPDDNGRIPLWGATEDSRMGMIAVL